MTREISACDILDPYVRNRVLDSRFLDPGSEHEAGQLLLRLAADIVLARTADERRLIADAIRRCIDRISPSSSGV